jgi:exopolysaccharide biosynthesis polyprenyl glycosylphosphotransferase
LVFVATSFFLLLTERLLLARWARHQFEAGHARARLLLVGASAHAGRVVARLAEGAMAPLVVGVVVPNAEAAEPGDASLSVLGQVRGFADILHEQAVDHVLLLPPFERLSDVTEVLERCEERGVAVEFLLPTDETGMRQPRVAEMHGLPVMTYDAPPKRAELLAVKQLFDTVGSFAGLLLISPLLLVVALSILLTMGRPVLFAQERIGRNGRRFEMLKFRTMVKDAEARKAELAPLNEAGGPVFKMQRDPRITPLGAFLRRTSIDELPQLFNVVAGSMSLVGPRPLPVREQQQIFGAQRRRLAMKPGITGLWQVSGRSNITFDEWMKLDLEYVDRWTLSLDFVILARTIPAVLFARGAR